MTRRKLKIPKYQNTKTKDLQSSQEENQLPHLPPCEASHKKIKDPQNDKKKIEDSKISKYQNKKYFKVHKKKGTYLVSSCVKLHTKNLEDPQNEKKKIEDFRTSKYQNKRPLKFLEEKKILHLPPYETSHK